MATSQDLFTTDIGSSDRTQKLPCLACPVTSSTPGLRISFKYNEFRVSDRDPSSGNYRFSSIKIFAARDFTVFSSKRLASPVRDNKIEINFSVRANDTKAIVEGVYVDVHKSYVARTTYYNKNGCVLTEQYVDGRNKVLSFLGVYYKKAVIAKVVVGPGNCALDSRKGGDFVVMHDFMYGELQALW
eukprot:Plantae.Rhodophyta-Purpureofilum_apyrenoidigerum.ctg5475.p1 GENE.Plantae.Rhodophyta-Purpureofilum_apyrenoidigerum.ctg5475~~Plantae.Rhodophyta-Purpureofilum_apyrenoidigerum.ctg5475.p1  ORF type:complete len:186 (+),score=35.35 Plantae.Rhodophyta-Purpureofilum_apyrenoidigerum.ctg5475:412-969(+)